MTRAELSLAAAIQEASEVVRTLTHEIRAAHFVLTHGEPRMIAMVTDGLVSATHGAQMTRLIAARDERKAKPAASEQ